MNRTPVLALIAAALTLALGACNSAPARPPVVASVTTTAPATSSTTTAQTSGSHGIPDSAFAGLKPFTGPAVAKYGQATLAAAYKEMVNFAFVSGWNSALIAKNSALLSRADIAFAVSYLTPAGRTAFLANFAKVMQGDKAATSKLEEVMFFGVTAPNGLKSVPSGKVVANRKFSQASVGIDTSHGERLAMSFAARGDIQLVDKNQAHKMLRTSRVLNYLLVPNTGADRSTRPFLIDSWSIKMSVNTPITVP